MNPDPTLYDVLSISIAASTSEVKAAFRAAALRYHPDTNGGDAGAAALFALAHNAYQTLKDPKRRTEYDAFLRGNTRLSGRMPRHRAHPARVAGHIETGAASLELVFAHMSYVLWDVEDMLATDAPSRLVDGIAVERHLLGLLAFMDNWVLTPCGFPDYFYEARGMKPQVGRTPALPPDGSGHQPFNSLADYFYNVRRRLDRLLGKASLVDLLATVPGTGLQVIDCVIEAHDFGIHRVASLKAILSGEKDHLEVFRHSSSEFQDRPDSGV